MVADVLEQWPAEVCGQLKKRSPEQVKFNEPPARFLKRILGGRYKKTTTAMNLFPRVDPQVAIDRCPHLKLLAEDLLGSSPLAVGSETSGSPVQARMI